MKVLVFDVRGKIAHFRRPDTTATHLTYPFITPTAAKGLVGAVLGITDFTTSDKIGIQLLNPVETSAQQLSLLGKPGGTVFNRPTTQEILINPAYRIYYAGDEYFEELKKYLEEGKSVYPTYLGAAFALTKPEYRGELEGSKITGITGFENFITSKTVVPASLIRELKVEKDKYYSRASGFLYEYLGDREFDKSIDFIYEKSGQEITFLPGDPESIDSLELEVINTEDGVICLF